MQTDLQKKIHFLLTDKKMDARRQEVLHTRMKSISVQGIPRECVFDEENKPRSDIGKATLWEIVEGETIPSANMLESIGFDYGMDDKQRQELMKLAPKDVPKPQYSQFRLEIRKLPEKLKEFSEQKREVKKKTRTKPKTVQEAPADEPVAPEKELLKSEPFESASTVETAVYVPEEVPLDSHKHTEWSKIAINTPLQKVLLPILERRWVDEEGTLYTQKPGKEQVKPFTLNMASKMGIMTPQMVSYGLAHGIRPSRMSTQRREAFRAEERSALDVLLNRLKATDNETAKARAAFDATLEEMEKERAKGIELVEAHKDFMPPPAWVNVYDAASPMSREMIRLTASRWVDAQEKKFYSEPTNANQTPATPENLTSVRTAYNMKGLLGKMLTGEVPKAKAGSAKLELAFLKEFLEAIKATPDEQNCVITAYELQIAEQQAKKSKKPEQPETEASVDTVHQNALEQQRA